MVLDMDYKTLLKERALMGKELAQDAAPLRWIEFRNREYLRDWYRRRAWPEHLVTAHSRRSANVRSTSWLSTVQGHLP